MISNMATISKDNLPEALATLPSEDSLILLFKHAKHTVLLSVMPDEPFSNVKVLLLTALRSRSISTISDVPLPDDPEEIEFGVLIDRRDPSKGWTPLRIRLQEIADGKEAKKKGGGKKGVPCETPAGAGLVDGSWVAFRVKPDLRAGKKESDDEGISDIDIPEDPGWSVVIPTWDDESDR